MIKEIREKMKLLSAAFNKVLYSTDDYFLENMKSSNLAGDDIEKYRYWEWTQGVGLYGLWKMYKYTGEDEYLTQLCTYYDQRLKEGLPAKNINTVAPLLTLAFLFEETRNEQYLTTCQEWAEWIMQQLPRTNEGGFQHITSDTLNEEELWDDTLFMCVLFLAKMGDLEKNKLYIEEAKYQFLLHAKYLQDKQTGLWYHGWTFAGRNNFAKALWGRGNCWITLAIPEFLSIVSVEPSLKRYLKQILLNQVESLKKRQKSNGMWYTLLDDSTSYEEASATCGFAAGILNAISQGILDESYSLVAFKSLEPILSLIDDEGLLHQVSYGTPMGRETKDFYKQIPISVMPYGQALGMLYLIEVLRYNKKIEDN